MNDDKALTMRRFRNLAEEIGNRGGDFDPDEYRNHVEVFEAEQECLDEGWTLEEIDRAWEGK